MAFSRIPAEVLNHSRLIDADPGDILINPGQNSAHVFVIETGLLLIDREFPTGDRSVRIAGPGEIAGEEAIIGEPYLQRAEALVPSRVRALNLSQPQLDLVSCRWLMTQLTLQLQQAGEETHWMRSHSVEHRVQLHLLALHGKTNGSEIPISQADFASVVGTTRETISTALNRLARLDIIRLGRRSITVVRPENLGVRRAQGAGSGS